MDHQVVDDRDIRTTGIEFSETMRFDKQGLIQVLTGCKKSRIKSFHMTDLRFHTGFCNKGNKFF